MRSTEINDLPDPEALSTRMDQVTLNNGMNIFASVNNGRLHVRAFGLMYLAGGMYDAFSSSGSNRGAAVARSLFEHCRQSLTSGTVVPTVRRIAQQAVWSGLFSEDHWDNMEGLVGVSIDVVLGATPRGPFLIALEAYFRNNGFTVTLQNVAEAFNIGNPTQVSRRDVSELTERELVVCKTPVDLRKFFVNKVPQAPPTKYDYC